MSGIEWFGMTWGFRGWNRWGHAEVDLPDGSWLKLHVAWTGDNYAGYMERWWFGGGRVRVLMEDFEPQHEVSLSTVQGWLLHTVEQQMLKEVM